MLKKAALIVLLLGSSFAPLVWSQDDLDDEVQASDESVGDDEADVADQNLDDEGTLEESADVSDVDAAEDVSSDLTEEDDLADESGEDTETESADSEMAPAPAPAPAPPVASAPPPAAAPPIDSCGNSKAGSDLQRGTVTSFNEAKGFGYIRSDDGQQVFVHSSSIQSGAGPKILLATQGVTFLLVCRNGKPVADKVLTQ